MGVATGCSCKEVNRFPHTTYPYSSCICTFFTQYKHIPATTGIQRHPYTVLYMKKHTQTYASYPAMDISCMSMV